eukprot:jgi/Botrbrau1/15615/Bobra.4_1s0003.1
MSRRSLLLLLRCAVIVKFAQARHHPQMDVLKLGKMEENMPFPHLAKVNKFNDETLGSLFPEAFRSKVDTLMDSVMGGNAASIIPDALPGFNTPRNASEQPAPFDLPSEPLSDTDPLEMPGPDDLPEVMLPGMEPRSDASAGTPARPTPSGGQDSRRAGVPSRHPVTASPAVPVKGTPAVSRPALPSTTLPKANGVGSSGGPHPLQAISQPLPQVLKAAPSPVPAQAQLPQVLRPAPSPAPAKVVLPKVFKPAPSLAPAQEQLSQLLHRIVDAVPSIAPAQAYFPQTWFSHSAAPAPQDARLGGPLAPAPAPAVKGPPVISGVSMNVSRPISATDVQPLTLTLTATAVAAPGAGPAPQPDPNLLRTVLQRVIDGLNWITISPVQVLTRTYGYPGSGPTAGPAASPAAGPVVGPATSGLVPAPLVGPVLSTSGNPLGQSSVPLFTPVQKDILAHLTAKPPSEAFPIGGGAQPVDIPTLPPAYTRRAVGIPQGSDSSQSTLANIPGNTDLLLLSPSQWQALEHLKGLPQVQPFPITGNAVPAPGPAPQLPADAVSWVPVQGGQTPPARAQWGNLAQIPAASVPGVPSPVGQVAPQPVVAIAIAQAPFQVGTAASAPAGWANMGLSTKMAPSADPKGTGTTALAGLVTQQVASADHGWANVGAIHMVGEPQLPSWQNAAAPSPLLTEVSTSMGDHWGNTGSEAGVGRLSLGNAAAPFPLRGDSIAILQPQWGTVGAVTTAERPRDPSHASAAGPSTVLLDSTEALLAQWGSLWSRPVLPTPASSGTAPIASLPVNLGLPQLAGSFLPEQQNSPAGSPVGPLGTISAIPGAEALLDAFESRAGRRPTPGPAASRSSKAPLREDFFSWVEKADAETVGSTVETITNSVEEVEAWGPTAATPMGPNLEQEGHGQVSAVRAALPAVDPTPASRAAALSGDLLVAPAPMLPAPAGALGSVAPSSGPGASAPAPLAGTAAEASGDVTSNERDTPRDTSSPRGPGFETPTDKAFTEWKSQASPAKAVPSYEEEDQDLPQWSPAPARGPTERLSPQSSGQESWAEEESPYDTAPSYLSRWGPTSKSEPEEATSTADAEQNQGSNGPSTAPSSDEPEMEWLKGTPLPAKQIDLGRGARRWNAPTPAPAPTPSLLDFLDPRNAPSVSQTLTDLSRLPLGALNQTSAAIAGAINAVTAALGNKGPVPAPADAPAPTPAWAPSGRSRSTPRGPGMVPPTASQGPSASAPTDSANGFRSMLDAIGKSLDNGLIASLGGGPPTLARNYAPGRTARSPSSRSFESPRMTPGSPRPSPLSSTAEAVTEQELAEWPRSPSAGRPESPAAGPSGGRTASSAKHTAATLGPSAPSDVTETDTGSAAGFRNMLDSIAISLGEAREAALGESSPSARPFTSFASSKRPRAISRDPSDGPAGAPWTAPSASPMEGLPEQAPSAWARSPSSSSPAAGPSGGLAEGSSKQNAASWGDSVSDFTEPDAGSAAGFRNMLDSMAMSLEQGLSAVMGNAPSSGRPGAATEGLAASSKSHNPGSMTAGVEGLPEGPSLAMPLRTSHSGLGVPAAGPSGGQPAQSEKFGGDADKASNDGDALLPHPQDINGLVQTVVGAGKYYPRAHAEGSAALPLVPAGGPSAMPHGDEYGASNEGA